MGSRRGVYNGPPVHISWSEKKRAPGPHLHFRKQETNRLQDYKFMTRLLLYFEIYTLIQKPATGIG